MHEEEVHAFLVALTVVLGVAGVITLVFQRLRQPVVLGYILAGVLVGPYVPLPFEANRTIIQTLSELGVIMLMFGLGLEFSIGKLIRAAPTAGVTALLQSSLMVWLGYLAAQLLGWSFFECIFAGAMIASSSTTIIAKVFDELKIKGDLRDLVVAILIVEDLIAVVLMALLTGFAQGSGLSPNELMRTIGKLGGFLIVFVVVGLLIVPALMRSVVRQGRAETTGAMAIAICFGSALLAQTFGYSVALGAFVGGMLVAESGETHAIEPVVNPVRDMFAAVFFVSVGMMIDPGLILEHWLAIAVFTLVVIVGKLVGVTVGGVLTGTSARTSIAAGMSLSQIGEFAFIIASLGLALGVIGSHVYAVAVAASAVTTLTTPWLIRSSGPVSDWVDRKLPGPLQAFIGLYASWIERMRASRPESRSVLRRHVRIIVIDLLVVSGVVIATAQLFDALTARLAETLSLELALSQVLVSVAAGLLAVPFCTSILLSTRGFALAFAELVIPPSPRKGVDLGLASRLMLTGAIELAGLLVAGLPLVAITQPFLHNYWLALAMLALFSVAGVIAWRRAANLQGHLRATSQLVIELLAAQTAPQHGPASAPSSPLPLELLPGIGTPTSVTVAEGSEAARKTLAELSLRATTGATVLAIRRGAEGIPTPTANEQLLPGDQVVVTGTQAAIEAATLLLTAAKA